MDIELLKEKWTLKKKDTASERAAWDSVAGDYLHTERHSFSSDSFLRFVDEKASPDSAMKVLDVGCGAGAYSMAFAGRCESVDGVDLSAEMIRLAEGYASSHGISNARFSVCDWHSCDPGSFRGRYDLVFAHNTPAIGDFDSFMKLISSSRKYCFMSRPARRTDSVFDRVREIAGIVPDGTDTIPLIFEILWELGSSPEFRYDKTVWTDERSPDDAATWYLGRLRGQFDIDGPTERKIRSFLSDIAVDGKVREITETTVVSIFWTVDDIKKTYM